MHNIRKTNYWILRKEKKVHFWALFAQIGANKNFPKNRIWSIFTVYSPLTSCTISEKNNDWIPNNWAPSLLSLYANLMSQFWEKLVYRRTDGQHSFHRTFRLRRGSKKWCMPWVIYQVKNEILCMYICVL